MTKSKMLIPLEKHTDPKIGKLSSKKISNLAEDSPEEDDDDAKKLSPPVRRDNKSKTLVSENQDLDIIVENEDELKALLQTNNKNRRGGVKINTRGNIYLIEKNINREIMGLFLKKKVNYFEDSTLKVKFSMRFNPGDCFGVSNVLGQTIKKRAIIAETDCKVLTIKALAFRGVLDSEKRKFAKKIGAFSSLFRKFMNPRIIDFSHFWSEENHKMGEVIYNEGDDATGIYIVGDGEIVLSKKFHEAKPDSYHLRPLLVKTHNEKAKYMLTRISPGTAFGEDDFLKNSKRISTASVTSNQTEIYHLNFEVDFHILIIN